MESHANCKLILPSPPLQQHMWRFLQHPATFFFSSHRHPLTQNCLFICEWFRILRHPDVSINISVIMCHVLMMGEEREGGRRKAEMLKRQLSFKGVPQTAISVNLSKNSFYFYHPVCVERGTSNRYNFLLTRRRYLFCLFSIRYIFNNEGWLWMLHHSGDLNFDLIDVGLSQAHPSAN